MQSKLIMSRNLFLTYRFTRRKDKIKMDTKWIISGIIIFILISLQYTLNLILREIRDIRKVLIRKESNIDSKIRERGE